jgi:arylsulfatase A
VWEGGYREPGIAWWPGKIKAGSSTAAIAATYDIFPTVLRLAGGPPPPPGLTIDGIDLGPVLFGGSGKGHECITFYWNAHAATAADPTNLAAVRCKDHKVYWWVQPLAVLSFAGPPSSFLFNAASKVERVAAN